MVRRFLEQTISVARSKDESGVSRLLELRVRIPLGGAIMSVSCECYAFSGRGLCDGPIHLSELPYRDRLYVFR